jgi:CubicO group peptidase (beta-lactamase class C family)
LKTYTHILAAAVFVCACNSKPKKTIADAPPPPANAAIASLSHEDVNKYYPAVSKFFDSLLLSKGFNGGILVAKNGSILYEKYTGLQDLRKKDSLTAQSSLHIASTSKTFTGMAILRLIQEGRLGLNDSLSSFFRDFPYPGVTVKMLLSHRSGLPNYIYYLSEKKNWDRNVFVTNQDVLNSLYNIHPGVTSRPGTRFHYCNTNFVLLAMIIEKLTGLNYSKYIKQTFFDPFGMKNTYVYSHEDSLTAIPSFKWNGGLWQEDQFDRTYGDKNIYSTPEDLLKWDQAIYSGLVINKQLLDSAFTPYSNERRSIHNYGLGMRLLIFPNGKKVTYHNGRWHGYNSFFAHLPDENVTIIVLSNKFNSRVYSTRYIYDIFGPYMHERNDAGEEENDNGNGNGTSQAINKTNSGKSESVTYKFSAPAKIAKR